MPVANRVAFSLFGQPVYWYGLVIAAGVLLGGVLAMLREKRVGLKKDTALDFSLVAIPAALIFARLYYVVFSWSLYADNPLSVLNFRQGGMAIYGGIIGGVIVGLIFSRAKKVSFGKLADLVAPSLALGQAMGRWGNYFNQEAFGDVVTHPTWQFFPFAVYIEALNEWHYATFFYESAWCFLLVAALLLAERRGWFRGDGDLFIWYAILYAAERAAVEGLRTDSLYWGDVRVSQLLSLMALLAGCVLFLVRAVRLSRTRRAIVPFVACVALILMFLWPGEPLVIARQFAAALLSLIAAVWLYRLSRPMEPVPQIKP